ncbi:hypothetical protein BHM03_00031738 [Ensete ventricosum]|uniref:Uncharacterized protein n=1 Tax=Ensete ventricosum TaxID=4639 RepID=A0A427B0J4_ENSVE|nr:hypothetical protein B296_00020833 [Ensete ventricosum]RZS01804.1 hypothetical protein BHM03_00031738 [Ensete ventricosum]
MRDGDLQEVVAGAEGEEIVDLLRKWTSPCRGTTPPAAASQRVLHRHLSLRSPPPPPDPFSPFLSSKLAKVGAGPRTAVHAEGETDLKALLEYGTAVQNCLAAALVLKEHYLKGLQQSGNDSAKYWIKVWFEA